jgi:hypothetical protein
MSATRLSVRDGVLYWLNDAGHAVAPAIADAASELVLAADYERDVAAARDKALDDAIEAVEALPGSPRGTRIGRTSALTDAVAEIAALRKPVDGAE